MEDAGRYVSLWWCLALAQGLSWPPALQPPAGNSLSLPGERGVEPEGCWGAGREGRNGPGVGGASPGICHVSHWVHGPPSPLLFFHTEQLHIWSPCTGGSGICHDPWVRLSSGSIVPGLVPSCVTAVRKDRPSQRCGCRICGDFTSAIVDSKNRARTSCNV